jgi:hypothetical protein
MPSSNLKIDFISTQQSQKEVSINVAIQALDTAVAGRFVADLSQAPATLALAEADCANAFLKFTGIPARTVALTVAPRPWLWVVESALSGPNSNCIIKTEGHDGVTITAGMKAVVYCDGVEVSFLGSASDEGDLQAAVSGHLVKDITGAVNLTLSEAEALNAFLTFTGVPGPVATLVLPDTPRFWIVDSRTTGANAAVSLKTPTGAAVALPAGPVSVYSDGVAVSVISDLSGLLERVAVLEGQGASTRSLASHLVKDLTGLASPIALTAEEADNNILTFTGNNGAVTIIVPAAARSWTIENKTVQSNLTVKTQGGAGIQLPPMLPSGTYTVQAYCNGTDVKRLASNVTAFHAQFSGKPAAGQALIGYVSSGRTMLPKGLSHPYRVGVAPAGSPGFSVRKAAYGSPLPGDYIGGFQIYANSTYGAFVPNTDVTLEDGDFLYIEAPAGTDANLSDLFIALNLVRLD